MSPTRMSKLEAAIRTVLAFNEACNRHDLAGIRQVLGEDCVFEHYHPAPRGTAYMEREAVGQFWQEFFRAYPKARIEIEEIFSLGERCIMRWRLCRDDREGEEARLRGVDIFRVRGGAIREQLSYVKG